MGGGQLNLVEKKTNRGESNAAQTEWAKQTKKKNFASNASPYLNSLKLPNKGADS